MIDFAILVEDARHASLHCNHFQRRPDPMAAVEGELVEHTATRLSAPGTAVLGQNVS